MQTLTGSKYFNSKQFAAALDISDRQFRRRKARGALPAPLPIAGALLWEPAAVRDYAKTARAN
ncbi:MAG: hypothetical protein ACRYGP_21680 [Janthinobacterium lividum]